MYALSIGVQSIGQSLPLPVYALLSGLNASTVGIIALAGVQLAEKAIGDRLTRILVIFGACAGLCYNTLWYFPTLMVIGGSATAIWDGWMAQHLRKLKIHWEQRQERPAVADVQIESGSPNGQQNIPLAERTVQSGTAETQRAVVQANDQFAEDSTMRARKAGPSSKTLSENTADVAESTPRQHSVVADSNVQPGQDHLISIRKGIFTTIVFFASFIAVLVARDALHPAPLILDLFANMYLAGTIIFGGGPVVIPLLRSYVVDRGWVSGRDFLIGLALIQSFPGPNFNFAVFLGALALQKSRFPTVFGAFLGGLGIFLPGITLAVAVQSFWGVLRKRKWVVDFLRGVNATAVGLVFTAVYRL
ncbi:hypothetical protein LTR78_010961 [Recurvomyces mirabilis]|uniref:Chromate ion transporter n=1 Tax=Recurvomyces mirabilis TaxID=574656 RepID=A0AAE0TP60_9PEZI|nr:hypothetical protein LTR78_010961 [Recurvomyces mirabilis]KAK5150378.1 hypothetical protein LTS14_010217 [Recurvomyces mirabilis]